MAEYFCNDWNDFVDGQSDVGPGETTQDVRFDGWFVTYRYTISWIDGCVTTVGRQDVSDPAGEVGKTCSDIMKDNYLNCDNGGVGGTTQVGCLAMSFTGAE
jgi:hypothetical protein